ncbi:hypothetical protein [Enterococcus rotai]|uniref:hypothetical protein n=1 Tax=Enterococcus rotai TaxID=118060 RepID=UPI0032B45A4E
MNLKEMIKNKKIVTASIAVLLVAGVAVGGKVYADNQKAQEQERIAKVEKDQQAKEKQLKTDTEKAVNDLFEKAIIDNKDAEKIAIKNDLKDDTVKKVKEQYFVEKTNDAWQKVINDSIVNADNQLKQIDTAKKAVEKVFKDNKVVNTDQKNIDAAKKEVDKIKNAKSKKELSDKLAKVKQEVDRKAKEKEKKTESKQNDTEQSQVKQEEVQQEQPVSQQQVTEQPVYQEEVATTSNNDWGGQAQQQPVQEQVQSVPTPPVSGGNQAPEQPVTPPSSGGGTQQPSYPDYPIGEQTGDIPENGGSWTGGWEEVK